MDIKIRNESDKNRLIEWIKSRKGIWYGEIHKFFAKRTPSQNRYMHLLFTWMGKDLGYTIEEVKYLLKISLGYIKTIEFVDGKEIIVPKSTADMSTIEANKFVAESRQLIYDEFGYEYPEPEQMIEHYYQLAERHTK